MSIERNEVTAADTVSCVTHCPRCDARLSRSLDRRELSAGAQWARDMLGAHYAANHEATK